MNRPPPLRAPIAAAAAFLLCLAAMPAAAQDPGRIQGTVVAQGTNRPLSGAQVYVEDVNIGQVTGENGRFLLLNVPAGTHTVSVQMIGYGTQKQDVTVEAGQAATVSFQLSESALALDELVVTGTAAEVRRKEIGNSLDAVTSKQIENAPVTNTQDILGGRAPGVTVMQSGGQPGNGGTIKIRGTNSVTQDVEPLIYVDGIRIYNLPTRAGWGGRGGTNPLQDIPSEDIERIEVIKGAAATTLYGTEASSGVIQIFTKKGIQGEPIWNAEVSAGVSLQGRVGPEGDATQLYTNCSGTMRGIITSGSQIGQYQEFTDPTCPSDGNWFQPGPQQSYSLSVRGGANKITYYVSGNYGDNKGTLPTSYAKDGGFRGNFSFSPIDKLTFALNTSYTRRKMRAVQDGNNSSGFLLNVGRGYRNYLKGGKGDDCANVTGDVICVTNSYLFSDGENVTHVDHFISGFTIKYDPLENLTNRLAIGWDFTDINNNTTLDWNNLDDPPGYYWDENTRHQKLSFDYAGSLTNDISQDLASTFSWGGQIFRDHQRWTEIDVGQFAGPGTPTLETGAALNYRADQPFSETSAGFFLQELLGIRDRLFITGGLRVDGNSAFGENFGLQAYPKVSVAYALSDYDFWPTDWFDTFKLRGAMGYSGKAPGTFDKLRTWAPISGNEAEPGFTPNDVGNADVGPEKTREIEVGFDASLFTGRLGLQVTQYWDHTYDALVGVTLPPSQGFLASRTENVGELVSSGFEAQVNLGLVRTNLIDWRVRSNVSLMKSDALDLQGEQVFADNKAEFREGYATPTYFGYKVMNPDAIADPNIESDQALGNVFPTQLLGFGTTLSIGNDLTLDALVEHQGNFMLPNYTGYQNARRGAWIPCFDIQQKLVAAEGADLQWGTSDDVPSELAGVTALQRAQCSLSSHDAGGGPNSDYWVESADFTKLRSVSLTYNVPAHLVPWARNASVTLAGRNLFLWSSYHNSDPEVEDFADRASTVFDGNGDFGRRDYYQIPAPRTFLLSVRFSF